MSRAALLPTPGDPYIAKLWVNSFERFWKTEVDNLYVSINSALPEAVMDYTASLYEKAGAKVIMTKAGYLNHGAALAKLLPLVQEDKILFLEDDFYIMAPGAVSSWFQPVEANANMATVSFRGSCSDGVRKRIVEKYGLSGDLFWQPNFWPCLCAAHKEHILKTDLWFDSKTYPAGQYIKELDWTPAETECGDTFVWTSIQLRAMGLDFTYFPQRRLIDVIHHGENHPPWLHSGAKALLNYSLLDKNNIPLGSRFSGPHKLLPPPDEGLRQDYCRRNAMATLISNRFPIPGELEAASFNLTYRKSLDKFMSECGLPVPEIHKQIAFFSSLVAPLL